LFKKVKFIGSQIFLKDLPYYAYICYLVNKNMKVTYAKSSGAAAVKLKGKKTLKLIVVKLPSTQIYYFAKTTKCFIGKRVNFFVNKFIEGKWGYGVHRFKKINVRGVAMNPVDHPNGGRTKAKQPEKSP
jgi:ribosomal protein L2